MSSDPKIIFDPEPDPLETSVRLACGAVFGLVPAGCIALLAGPFTVVECIALFGTGAAVCGLLAMRYGDAFWHAVLQAIRALI